ncbi:MAG TPA: non-canonical purine NTP pyrophosphatase [Acidobacteriaceae bacterium]
MILYAATSNPGKLRDFAQASYPPFDIRPLPGLGSIPAPEEDQPTFAGNARLKAVYYSLRAPGALVLADDSGLEVDALALAPGVYSARFAERAGASPHGLPPDVANNHHLLQQLAPFFRAGRETCSARYCCVLVAARDGAPLAVAEGTVEGSILPAPRGTGGFGYDPLFYLPSLGCTMADLDAGTRLALSHRGHALRSLLPKLADCV